MESSDDRAVIDLTHPRRNGRGRNEMLPDIYVGSARTAPRGADSRIGDDETHRRLQEIRNRARHSTEDLVRRELGPDWAQD